MILNKLVNYESLNYHNDNYNVNNPSFAVQYTHLEPEIKKGYCWTDFGVRQICDDLHLKNKVKVKYKTDHIK